MIRWTNRILFVLNATMLGGVVWYLGTRGLNPVHQGLEYKDLISIILSAIAVLLSAVTIFVAVAAIWGYNSIREASVKAAIAAAEIEASKVATNVASTTAAREAAAFLTLSGGTGEPGKTNELAAALKSDGKRAAAKPKLAAGQVRVRKRADKS